MEPPIWPIFIEQNLGQIVNTFNSSVLDPEGNQNVAVRLLGRRATTGFWSEF